jgi:hypothetical protein
LDEPVIIPIEINLLLLREVRFQFSPVAARNISLSQKELIFPATVEPLNSSSLVDVTVLILDDFKYSKIN